MLVEKLWCAWGKKETKKQKRKDQWKLIASPETDSIGIEYRWIYISSLCRNIYSMNCIDVLVKHLEKIKWNPCFLFLNKINSRFNYSHDCNKINHMDKWYMSSELGWPSTVMPMPERVMRKLIDLTM